MHTPFYDPLKSYEENFHEGPFGALAEGPVFKNEKEPLAEFFGQKVFLPFGIAAGPLINGKFIKAALNKGFDICTYKTVRAKQYPCNPMPNVVPVRVNRLTVEQAESGVQLADKFSSSPTVTNSFGVPSFDPNFWQPDMREAVLAAGKGQVVIGSFQGTARGGSLQDYIQDFADCAHLVKETGAKVLEVNLSCPNEGSSHLLCFDIPRARQVVEAIKNEIGNTPLIIKIAYYKDQLMLERLVEAVGSLADGIEAINSVMSKIVDERGDSGFRDGRKFSGVCGAAIKWAGLEMVGRLKKLREEKGFNFTIIGVGGVMDASDFREYQSAGAGAVMSATGVMWNPLLAQEIKQTIND